MIKHPADVTPLIDLLAERGTGPTPTRRPVYEDLLPPCNQVCPAGENIQGWLEQVRSGRYRDAWPTLTRDNPFPAIHGRVCYHPCENQCNRGALDSTVSIHSVERFLGDLAMQEGWQLPVEAPASGKRVLVVGAGPSGLSAAYHLARLGHAVEIRDAGPLPGGMLHFGIPAYRLPREVLMQEVRRIEAMGVRIVLDHKVEDLLAEQAAGGFDAAFVAIGAPASKHVDIPARDAARVLDAITLLREVGAGGQLQLGRRVVVYGDGPGARRGRCGCVGTVQSDLPTRHRCRDVTAVAGSGAQHAGGDAAAIVVDCRAPWAYPGSVGCQHRGGDGGRCFQISVGRCGRGHDNCRLATPRPRTYADSHRRPDRLAVRTRH